MSDSIPAHIRAELDVTPAWWDQQYHALVTKHIPRDLDYHADHDLDDGIQFYASSYSIAPWCITCGIRLGRTPDG
ncbi:hypothetical protein AB0E56_13125 [Microbacterium sp. NPDC028030]|uniref:hypothetical protein n=1 Tax=Microbacterium sp. NPDC028030 TaxID=3155124 RepID=UPI0033ED5884